MLKLGCKISFGLQSRLFFIPRLKRCSVAKLSFERKDYSSSAPVRYASKKLCKANGKEIYWSSDGSEKYRYSTGLGSSSSGYELPNSGRRAGRGGFSDISNEIQPRNHERSSVDNLKQEDELTEEAAEDESSNPSIGMNEANRTALDAENMAVKLLAARAYTAVELKKKLIGKRFSPNIIDGIISDFQSRGLLNDSLYAESFSRSRWSSSTWGPRRIKQALYQKGISEAEANKAVKLVFEDGEEEGNQETRLGLSKQAMDQLFVQASKQWLRSRDAAKETRKSRMIQWLQYRGFNWAVIGFVLKKLESSECS